MNQDEIKPKTKFYVYLLIDPRNDRVFYVGKGCKKKDGSYRHREHISIAKNPNRKDYKKMPKLYNKIAKILREGFNDLKYYFIDCENEKKAFFEEIEMIKFYGKHNLCNLTDGGEGSSGRKHTKETRKKIGEANRGLLAGEKHYLWGKHLPEETRKKISESRKGKYAGEKNPMWGKHHSEESKKKMSESSKGLNAGEKHHMFEKHRSEETRKKISEARKGLYAGENNPSSKLNQKQAEEIREKYVPFKYTQNMLAKEYNVSISTISSIIYNKTYKTNQDPSKNLNHEENSKAA